mmetsp:Transcript_150326/g.262668  ORF Transcript_150326/g.262668 Transcript_150326/m.262668 type:complete len:246 (-) Transcript_150326:67-804(-)
MPVHVPSAPADDGVPIGGAWLVQPPTEPQELEYLGMFANDLNELPYFIKKYGGQLVRPMDVVDVLRQGDVVAVVRGRQEIGSRALGHRSLLALPTNECKKKVNTYRSSAWYTPVGSVVTEERVPEVFVDSSIRSKYMAITPMLKDEVRKKAPAIVHADGTGLTQVVTKDGDPWLHEILTQIHTRDGTPALINCAFREEGKPIINSIKDAIKVLMDHGEIKYLVVDNFMFAERRALEQAQPLRWGR